MQRQQNGIRRLPTKDIIGHKAIWHGATRLEMEWNNPMKKQCGGTPVLPLQVFPKQKTNWEYAMKKAKVWSSLI